MLKDLMFLSEIKLLQEVYKEVYKGPNDVVKIILFG